MRVIGTLASSGDTQAPTQPQNLSATAINRQRIDLTWTASTDNVGVTGYQVFRDGSPLDTSDTTTFSDTTVSASTAYTYTVVAFDAAGNNSVASASAGATTPANATPTWQTIADQELIVGDSYSLNLNDECDDADADTIEYTIASGTLPTGLALAAGIISGVPTTAGQALTVTVRADDGFDTADTDIVFETFTADVTAPPVPTGLAANASSLTQINVTWAASTDAAGTANEYVSGTQDYRVYRSTDGTNYSLRATVTTPAYSDTGLSAQTEYFYKVSSRDVELNESAQSSAASATTSVPSLEADWQARISGAGVVWYHDFRTAAEVNQFRWANAFGNDPNDVARPGQTTWVSDDGITGGCLETRHNVGGTPNPPEWWRPFSPLNGASNGRGIDDPAANGTIALRTFTPTSGGSQMANFGDNGFYGHADYVAQDPSAFDGTSYFIQARLKISANRTTAFTGSGDGGKVFYFTTNTESNANQEIVTNSNYNVTALGANRNLFQMYRSGGTGLVDDDPTSSRQVGTSLGTCQTSPTVVSSGCWFTPNDETSEGAGNFFTLLYEVHPGHDNGDDTIVRVWKADWGETSYTKIWDQSDVDLFYEPDRPFGHNALICSGYQNQIVFTEEIYHRYAQIIFSQETIPCPQVYEEESSTTPSWASALTLNAWTALTSANTFASVQAADIGQYGSSGPDGVFQAWNGAAVVDFGDAKSMLFWGGGHQDYYGNEVYCLDLDTLQFSRLTEPTALGSYAGPHTNGIYSDGNPSPAHTYYFVCARGSTFLIGRRQINNTPSTNNMISTFNPTTETWVNSTTANGISPGQGDGMCYDSARDLVWMVECDVLGWASWDPDTNTWTTYTAPASAFDPSAGPFYVPTKDCVIFFSGTNIIRGLDPASPNTNSVSLTRSGTAPAFGAGDMACWSANLGALVYYPDGSNNIYLLTPPSGDWRTGTWVWTQRTVSGTSGAHTGNGVYGRFQVVEYGSITVAIICDDPDNVPRAVRLS
jgi:chitodextrinase